MQNFVVIGSACFKQENTIGGTGTWYHHAWPVTSAASTRVSMEVCDVQAQINVMPIVYYIPIGDIPELSAMQVGDLPLTFATGTTTEGSPPSSANKFFLWHGGVPSAPINSGATAEEVSHWGCCLRVFFNLKTDSDSNHFSFHVFTYWVILYLWLSYGRIGLMCALGSPWDMRGFAI